MSLNRYVPSEFKFICWLTSLATKIPNLLGNYFSISEQNTTASYNNANVHSHNFSSVEDSHFSNDSSQILTLPGTGLGVESMIEVSFIHCQIISSSIIYSTVARMYIIGNNRRL